MRKSRAAGIIIGMTMAFTAVAPVMPIGTYVSAAETVVNVDSENSLKNNLSKKNTILKFTADIVLSNTLFIDNDDVVIDLNGHSLTYNSTNVAIDNNRTLTIMDSSASGSGSITNTGVGGCIDNDADATLTIAGGSISGNTAKGNGGGINNGGILNITGGSISGNTANDNGGGIYNSGTLTITGGSITGNTSAKGGGGIYNTGTINISGKVNITGNIRGSSKDDIYLANKSKISVTGDLTGSHIGVKMASKGAFTAGYSTYNPSLLPVNVFFSNDGYAVALKDSEAVFTDKKYKVQYQWKKNSDSTYNCTVTVDDGSGNNAYTKEYTGLAQGSLSEAYENDNSLILSSSIPSADSGLSAEIRNGQLIMKVTYVSTDGYITGIGFTVNGQDIEKNSFKARSATYSVKVGVGGSVTVTPYYIDNNDVRHNGGSTTVG